MKMMTWKARKGTTALLIVLIMLLLQLTGIGFPAASRADGTEKTISGLGTGTISSPAGAGQWNYVYYGVYDNNPVKYRVLSASTSDFGGRTMLLDCDSVLFTAAFDTNNSNDWGNSSIKNELNGNSFLAKNGVFTTAETNAIANSTKAEKNNDHDGNGLWNSEYNSGLRFAKLNGEKIFLLDAVEVTSSVYGYTNNIYADGYKIKSASTWWLRSPTPMGLVPAPWVTVAFQATSI